MTRKPFPAAIREKCHPNFPTSSCSERRESAGRGEFFYDYERGGWVSLLNPVRSMKDWQTIFNAGKDTRGEPYILEICPFCGCELPELRPPHICEED